MVDAKNVDLCQNHSDDYFDSTCRNEVQNCNVGFMTTYSPRTSHRRILGAAEKLEFVRTAVAWISDKDIVDTCFALNFGYDDPLPWPQV